MAKTKDTSLGLPDNVVTLLSAADKRNGLPVGTMQAVMQQEVGGGVSKYLADPTAYHYGLNAEGKRIAGHTGKTSTAFGPFGILESTASKPGYGVAPLKDKTLEEQVRFASDYLAARTRSSGGNLSAGLAGYGEGAKYAAQVSGRMGGNPEKVAAAKAPVADALAAVTQAPSTMGVTPAFSPSLWAALGEQLLPHQVQGTPESFFNPTKARASKVDEYASLYESLAALGDVPELQVFSALKGLG